MGNDLRERLEALSSEATQGEWIAVSDPCHFDSISDIVAGETRKSPRPRTQAPSFRCI